MRIARKLLLVAMLAMSVMAMSASSASALTVTGPVEAPDAGATACGALTETTTTADPTGGCHLNLASNGHVEFRRTVFPATTLRCNVTLEARVNGSGAGYLFDHVFSGCAEGSATPSECNDATHPYHWPFQIAGTGVGGNFAASSGDFCISVLGVKNECTLTNVTLSVATHQSGTLNLNGAPHKACAQAGLSVGGSFAVTPEGTEEVEVRP